ncbi:metallophosphoesterase [Prolixibacteraceae bacterium JC049]|nr:metallophosphoesterase [Prolixibacteraceae bacterium JC049]
MRKIIEIVGVLVLVTFFGSCQAKENSSDKGVKVALMADVHFHDVYGQLSDCDFPGVKHPETGQHMLVRTMKAQLNSTRLFNENYFAFRAALDDVVKRGIRYVAIPGDYSDDGQPVNVNGLKQLLDEYSKKHGIRFFVTTGNHDPVRPFTMAAGKKDFLGMGGKNQPIMSEEGLYQSKKDSEQPVVVSKDIAVWGYKEIMSTLANFGFSPQAADVYWETPYSHYAYNEYNFEKGRKASEYAQRQYVMKSVNAKIPDASYLVEPEDGLWFLAIDANAYAPKKSAATDPLNPRNYSGAGLGYSQVLAHKSHLVNWVKSVMERADKLGKKVVAFSHYPMVDFNDDASEHIEKLLGKKKMQLPRIPKNRVAEIFANAGVKVHFAGHMHINDTGVREFENGKSIVNVQVPSLAAYIPAYKVANISLKSMDVKTVMVDEVPDFKTIFPLYKMEHNYLKSIDDKGIWDESILSVANYHEFANWHLKELVRFRFFKKDWPKATKKVLMNSTGKELAALAGINNAKESWSKWTGYDMVVDLYRLRSADKLAIKDIGVERVKQYMLVIEQLLNSNALNVEKHVAKDLKEFGKVFKHFISGAPVMHFSVDLKSGAITDLNR